MTKADRLKLSIKNVKQEINNLKREYVIIESVKDRPQRRHAKLLKRKRQLEFELYQEVNK